MFGVVVEGKHVTTSSSSSSIKTGIKTSSKESSSQSSSSNDQQQQSLSLDVVELTSTNFASTVSDGNVWLIEFYTGWCKHCQNFKSQYESIAMTFHSAPQEKIRVAKVDCSVEKALATRFGVQGYPSFYVVSGWSVYEFEDARSESNLMSFARGGYKKQAVRSTTVGSSAGFRSHQSSISPLRFLSFLQPIPWMVSPMGPMGILQGSLIYIGTSIMGVLDLLQNKYNVPPPLAGVVFCMMGLLGGILSIVLLTILSSPREKVD